MDASVNEPILRSPIVLGLCAAFVIVHGLVFTLEMTDVLWVFSVFSFIPAQLGEGVKALANLVSFAFFHGSWEHVILNTLWLLVFGTPVAVRLETPARFMGLFLLTSVVSGLTHYVFHARLSGAACRGVRRGGRHVWRSDPVRLAGCIRLNPDQARKKLPLLPLRQTLSRRPVLVFIAVWMALNVVSGVSGLSPSGQSVSIAWQAHIGGFVAGLLLLPCFEKPPVSPSGGPGNVEYGRWAGS